MSRGYTPRHAQTAGDLSFAVQFNDETLWHFAQILRQATIMTMPGVPENPMIDTKIMNLLFRKLYQPNV